MELIYGDSICKSLIDVAPTRIAVAYIGSDWRKFINLDLLDEIIASPTLGSNPGAIRELVIKLGWGNVHFLTRLHSKIYIGETKAALGSFNLSKNGLGANTGSLEEAGVLVDKAEFIAQLLELYDYYKKSATQSFPSIQDKELALKSLEDAYNIAASARIITSGEHNAGMRSITDFTPLCDDDFYITPWEKLDLSFNYDVIAARFPQINSSTIRHVFSDTFPFSPSCCSQLKKGRWILYWKTTNKGKLDHRSTPTWMLIDDIIVNGATNPGYELLAVEINGHNGLSPPFELTDNVIKAFVQTLESKEFLLFTTSSVPEDAEWSIKNTFPLFKRFISEWKRASKDATN